MTEEIEAHVLKKYEILQKLGKSFAPEGSPIFYPTLLVPPISLQLQLRGERKLLWLIFMPMVSQ